MSSSLGHKVEKSPTFCILSPMFAAFRILAGTPERADLYSASRAAIRTIRWFCGKITFFCFGHCMSLFLQKTGKPQHFCQGAF